MNQSLLADPPRHAHGTLAFQGGRLSWRAIRLTRAIMAGAMTLHMLGTPVPVAAGTYASAIARSAELSQMESPDNFSAGFAFAIASASGGSSPLSLGTAYASAEASNKTVKLYAETEGHWPFPLLTAGATAGWNDTLRISAPPGTEIPALLYVDVRYEGLFSANPREELFTIPGTSTKVTQQGTAFAEGSLSILGKSFGGYASALYPSGDVDFFSVSERVAVPTELSTTFYDGVTRSFAFLSWSVGGSVSAHGVGPHFAGADVSQTIHIGKLYMHETGDLIPEDLGYTLEFESGFPSPNVPEPTTIVLALSGVLLTCWGVFRHRSR